MSIENEHIALINGRETGTSRSSIAPLLAATIAISPIYGYADTAYVYRSGISPTNKTQFIQRISLYNVELMPEMRTSRKLTAKIIGRQRIQFDNRLFD